MSGTGWLVCADVGSASVRDGFYLFAHSCIGGRLSAGSGMEGKGRTLSKRGRCMRAPCLFCPSFYLALVRA